MCRKHSLNGSGLNEKSFVIFLELLGWVSGPAEHCCARQYIPEAQGNISTSSFNNTLIITVEFYINFDFFKIIAPNIYLHKYNVLLKYYLFLFHRSFLLSLLKLYTQCQCLSFLTLVLSLSLESAAYPFLYGQLTSELGAGLVRMVFTRMVFSTPCHL